MSYYPGREKARAAYDSLRVEPPAWFMGTDIRPAFDQEDLWELLVAFYCPVVCVGEVNNEGWHRICEQVADAALNAIKVQMPYYKYVE